jgi:hypothetical protein
MKYWKQFPDRDPPLDLRSESRCEATKTNMKGIPPEIS